MGSVAAGDSAQWLSVKEETIFLHDGLIRVTDLAELPSEIGVTEAGDTELEILTFETKNPTELAERLRAVCGNQSNAYARLLEYRLNALRGLWNAQRQLALEEQHERDGSDEETIALLKRQGLLQQPEQAPFTSRMGLLLVFPLIQSQSKTDPSLCNITAEVLLNCLRDCQPLSLIKEPADCLNGIESLLCSWLEDTSTLDQQVSYKQKENSAAALVALACARGSLKTFIHTVHLLQKQTDLGSLPVADVLYRLLLLEGGPGSPSCLLGSKHIVSWGFEDMLPAPDGTSGSNNENKDADLGRCLASDGLYLYTTNSVGRGLSKLGSGLHGTLRGFVYCRNEELETGWIAYGSGKLFHRPVSFDNKPHFLFQIIDQYSLQVENGVYTARPLHERIILMRKEGESAKSINEMLLSRLSRYRASPSATLAALTGSTISNTLKEDQTVLASSLVFNISDGQFTNRADLIDAAGSSLGRGALVTGLGEAVTTNEVINQLLHHVGAMCIHQLNLLANSNSLPITNFLGKQHPIESHHLSSICDIMEKAMVNGDKCIIRCILVVFQVVFKFFLNPQTERNRDTIRRAGLLLWQLLMAPKDQICPEIQKEVCLAISGLSQLRDVILTNLTDQLQNNRFGSDEDEHYRLNDELLHYILKIVVRESCVLITKCQTVSKEEFQRLLSTVPVASPCLRYLMAVQNHLLSNTVLIKPDESDDSDSSLQGETLKELQTSTLGLATQILTGCDEVLEMLQRVTTALINSEFPDKDVRYTALLLKTQCTALADVGSSPSGISDQKSKLLADNRMLEEREEPGFLTGLKIPAPWAAGKTVETAHPVRDNYKFKESVHIPGARCLYLRFDSRCSSQYDYDKLVIYAGPNTNSRKVAEYGGNTLGYGSRSVLGTGWPKDLVKVEGDTVTFSFEMRSGREHNTPDKAMWGFSCTVRAQESSEDVSGGLPFLVDLALGLSVLACSMLRILYNGPEITKEELTCHDLLRSKLLQRCQWQVEANGALSPALTPSPSPLPLTIEEDREFTYPSDILLPPSGNYFELPRIRLTPGIMIKLREISGRARPQFRPSIKEVIQPDIMEEMVVSCVIKHLNLVDALQSLINYQYREEHLEEYDLLCKIMGETFKKLNAMERQLQKFFQEVNSSTQKSSHAMAKTKILVKSLMNRAELLLHVTIAAQSGITRSISNTPTEPPACKSTSEAKAISHAMRQPVFLRSMSAPSDLEMIGSNDLEFNRSNSRRRNAASHRSSSFTLLQSLAIEDSRDKPTYSVLLGQLFAFIGTNPDQAVSSSSFLLAAQTRWCRGNTRKQALVHMRELLTAAVRVGGVTHLVGPVTMMFLHRIEELTCGGMVEQVQEAFGETMTSVVSLCARYPIACANSIGLLCTIPYTRSEEKCLVRSGLVQLMDKLCSLSNQMESSSSEKQTKKQKVATMAWAAFQVLANRCVEWEKEEGGSTEAVHSGLARQVSTLLTNHLARATECCGNQAAGNDALQDVLSLLNDLSRSQIGKAILSQPACVSKLLSLLLDQRPSPKLVLIILQLCRAALPLMSVEDCGNVELPPWSYSVPSLNSEQEDPSDPASKIASLLLAKLADYVVPGCQTILSPTASEPDSSLSKNSPKGSQKGDKDTGEEIEAVDGKLSIFIHKREDQSSHEVLQPLLSSSEGRPFRLGTGANMEKVVKMDRDMTKVKSAAALRKATKWAQSGLIVSVGPPVETVSPETASGLSTGDKKKTAQTSVCRERNSDLARTDPVRPFISGHVANSMAAEVIALLHSLLMAPESNAAQIWTTTAEKVLSRALMHIPQLGKYAESILENGSGSGRKLAKLQSIARQAVAALCALGGFKETIKIGSEVQVLGIGVSGSVGVVVSINEQEGIATVKFPTLDFRKSSKASDTLTIPLFRLSVPRSEALPLHKLSITEKVVQAVQSMLLPQEGCLSIHTSLPATGDASTPVMAVVRLLAEIRTRACLVMAQLLEDSSFCEEFIQQCPAAVEVLNLVAQECSPGERLSVVEVQCERLRMLYRDCARPPPPPLQTERRLPKEITWCPSRVFPPVRACMFSSHLTAVTFLADPSAGGGLPRGTFIYATSPVPIQAPSFYWEIEIVSYGDIDDDTGPIVSFGFATEAEKRDGAWTNPVGTCLFHNNGRAVHYNGSSLLQWKSVRLDVALSPGDVAGIGWERTEGTPPPPGQPAKGRVYFTYCGQRLIPYLEDVSGGMWPVVHIQKKNTKIRANFGSRLFAFAEGQAHRNAADLCIDLAEEISANFEALPFAMASDSDNDAGTSIASDPGTHGPPCRIAAVATVSQQYDSDASCRYKVELSYENFITSGPDPHPPPIADDETDDDDDDDMPREDHYALLVKAWETKVFPTIRRRFRNEAERKSGLDQIKGALQLGMKLVNELVQVETYLRSEGVLVRYWYPIDMLERPPVGYRRMATNGLVTLDSTNIQIHRELLRCESALARLYCRVALLNIFAPKSPHTFTRLFHIPAIRDITLEHLQLLSNQLLTPPLPDGTITSSSILITQSLQHCIHSQNCSTTDLFYQGNAQAIREWLGVAITRALHQGEDSLLDLTKQICSFLQNAPEQFPSEEFPVTESKVSMDINFPGAAFVVVSCHESQSGFRKDSSLYKAPWARVLLYGLGHKVKRNGQLNLIESVCYPRDASPSNTGLTPPPTTNQYPPAIIPTDKIHVKLGVSPAPGAVLIIHSLPLEFPLAMAFTEQLLTWKLEDLDEKSEDELDTVPPSVLLQVVEFLSNLLWATDLAAVVKELLFHLLAELLRKVHHLEQKKNPAGLSSSIALQLNPCLAMLMALQTELRKLYDEETQNWASGNACGGSVSGVTEHGRFSTYFHALMEVCLSVAEVTLPINMSSAVIVMASTPATNLSDSSSSSSSSPGQTPQSPSLLSKRKKVKIKREKTTSAKRTSARGAENDPALLSMGGSKPEDMLWFHRALTLLMILRHLINKDPQGLGVTNDAIADASQALVGPTAHSRLLVISGIPTHLEESVVRGAIRKACNAHGGVFKDEIYIPLQDAEAIKAKEGTEGAECKTGAEKTPGVQVTDNMDISSSSSVTPAVSVSASASTSQASLCSSQGVSQATSEASMEQFVPELAVPPGLLEPNAVSSQESLDLSICSTGSMGSLGSLVEQLDNVETTSLPDVTGLLDNQPSMSRPIKGFAVVEVRSRAKIEKIRASLFNSSDLIGLSSLDGEDELMEMSTEEILTVSTVNQSLFDTQGIPGLGDYFTDKSLKGDKIVPEARDVLTEIFKSCILAEQMLSLTPTKYIKVSDIYLSKEQINSQTPGNLLHTFFTNVRPPKKVLEDQLTQILRKYGVPKPKFDKSKYSKTGKEQHPVKVVSTKRPVGKPSTKDKAVLNSVRTALSEKKPIVKPKSPDKSRPDEKDLDKSPTKKQEIAEEKFLTLDGFQKFVVDKAKQDIRSIWRAILSCGYDLHYERCACIDTRHAQKSSRKWTLEMDVALVQYINRLCRHLAITPARLHPHEVYLDMCDTADPRVSCLLSEIRGSENSYFCQAARQLACIPSSQLCVKLASGGDPTFAFNIRFTGEEVHGTSGSFRHFLWQVCKELQSSSLSLLLLCPSSAVNKNKGKYLLTPSPITYAEEQLLHFFGQLLGIAIRADVPLPLDLLPCFWKMLVGEPMDPETDLYEADILTHNYIKKFENNKEIYAAGIRNLRMRELKNQDCMNAVRAGLGSIIPLQLLTSLTALEMELRTCGLPFINLEFLKAHTMYQVGLMETDQHIEFFWCALEMFTQEELCKFIKFACNQERIPFTCPCKDGGPDTAHVPPYPMKIAPPDGATGSPDSRYIRVETCMFMIKLPQYSSLEIMLEKLRHAIHYREDPLSG
ncbi:hypothetical protein GDO78_007527 [Eleutherodactylus coqui]|uniref:HECT domain-containing protein n=1 Tax=Eleutherodactylus coqui TaxID=57060 RepID=A0A8J6KDM6_ELECQ|nr:hypothetical protein GDO78_007527 [Eleutherodactylus coqui]